MCTNNLTDGGDGSLIVNWTPEGSDPGTHGDDFIIVDYRPADGEDTSLVINWRPDPGSVQSGPGDEASNGGFRGGVTVAAGDINDGSTDSREAANSVAMESITIAHEGWLLI